ncbi:MAG: metallophosphoesterase [Candidatus Aegiribacteria sp.]
MNIAFTADVHLSEDSGHPERHRALQDIVDKIKSMGIGSLVIAGDLFDENCSSYAGFEEVCGNNPSIRFHVIPGNHDPDISGRIIVGDNIRIHDSLEVMEMDGLQTVFIPYSDSSGMAERLEGLDIHGRWILVGHGDYVSGTKERNPYEQGTYMPLYRRDVERYQPWKIFLGHIHKPADMGNVHYPGSPCGLDINETGRRRFLTFDTSTGKVSSSTVDTDVLFFQEKLLVIPDENELERLRNHALARIATWGLDREEKKKARIRVTVSGYTSDREAVMNCLKDVFSSYSFYDGEGPDISSLRVARDLKRNAIARKAIEFIEEMDWNFGGDEPEKEQVIEASLHVVFGEG